MVATPGIVAALFIVPEANVAVDLSSPLSIDLAQHIYLISHNLC